MSVIGDIGNPDIDGVDLNLLVVFDTVMRERSITGAARVLRRSQPAVSAAVARLRRQFRDELFTRTPTGVCPTPRAVELHRWVVPGLDYLRRAVVGEASFDPGRDRHDFAVGMSDDVEAALLPGVLAATRPYRGVRVLSRPCSSTTAVTMIDTSQIEMAICSASVTDAHHRMRRLFSSGYSCVFNPRLLRLPPQVSLEQYLEAPHLLVSFDGRRGIVDDVLEALGHSRTVVGSTAHFAGAAIQLAILPAICTMPTHAATRFAAKLDLQVCEPPIPMPRYDINLVWHVAAAADPAHDWFRSIIIDEIAQTAGQLAVESVAAADQTR